MNSGEVGHNMVGVRVGVRVGVGVGVGGVLWSANWVKAAWAEDMRAYLFSRGVAK